MAAVTMKWDTSGWTRTRKRWLRAVGKEALEASREEAREGARLAVLCTPPSHFGDTVAKALKRHKARIREDIAGKNPGAIAGKTIYTRRLQAGPDQGKLVAEVADVDGDAVGPFYIIQSSTPRFAHKQAVGDVNAFISSRPNVYPMKKRKNVYRRQWYGRRHWATQAAVNRAVRERQKQAGSLMAGWKALAHKAGGKLQAPIEKLRGKGRVVMKHRFPAGTGVTFTGFNQGKYPGLKKIVDRQKPYIYDKMKKIAEKYARRIKKKLK